MNWALYRLHHKYSIPPKRKNTTIILDPSEAVKQAINKPKNAKIELCMDASTDGSMVASTHGGCIQGLGMIP